MAVLARCLIIMLFVFWSAAAGFGSDKLDRTRQDLNQLRRQIRSTNQQLEAKQAAARKLVGELHAGERKLRLARQKLRRTRAELAKLQARIRDQRGVVRQARQRQADLDKRVRERLVVLYQGGETQVVKVLFSARSPAAVAEDYYFLQRMIRRDRALLEDYRRQVSQTEKELQRLAELEGSQRRALEERRRQERALSRAQAERKQLLARVRSDEEALAVLLHELEERAARLHELVGRLKRQAPAGPGETRFSANRGRLPWPVEGPVRVGFGTGRHPELGTRYDSHGIEIGVKGEKPIRAVWDGSVIFAKPFRGYGNLLIIDHGDGYYSLYAQASRLLRNVGDRVERGEKIAISGFEGSDVVYFEIRKGGTPLDPLRWLARRR